MRGGETRLTESEEGWEEEETLEAEGVEVPVWCHSNSIHILNIVFYKETLQEVFSHQIQHKQSK